MDYIHLKKTLIAVFDHFLSCHDMAELEEMMQAFEAGKSLVIKLPEAVHREDYEDDVLAHEDKRGDVLAREDKRSDVLAREDKRDDVLAREGITDDVPSYNHFIGHTHREKTINLDQKRTTSRIRRRKKSHDTDPITALEKEIKICNIPVMMDLSKLSKKKKEALREALASDNHHITFSKPALHGQHGFATARVSQRIKKETLSPAFTHIEHNDFHHQEHAYENSDAALREDLTTKIMLEIRKYKDPP